MILNSKRLQLIADMVPDCTCMADIGTDHALLPIYLTANGICNKAIASDVRSGPVKAAEKNIKKFGLTDKVFTRKGSGLLTLKPDECEVIVLAGMGGHLITEIIESSLEKAHNASCVILQPNTEDFVVRKYLSENSFIITDENAIKEGNHVYLVIACRYKEGHREYLNQTECRTGKILCKKKTQDSFDYYNKMKGNAMKIIKNINEAQSFSQANIQKLNEYINLVRWIDENVKG